MKTFKIIAYILLIALSLKYAHYRFKHPEKTETQLFLDMLRGFK
jgi:hypothetical protein